jgi:signal transduction histidine kinase
MVEARKNAEARLQLLSKLGALAETLEYERVLEAVAHLSIPELADWCIIDIFENGELRHATVAHRDPAKADLANELLRFPAQLHTQPFADHVMAGNSFHVANLKEAIDRVDPKFAVILRKVGARSCLLVPFLVMGKAVALAVFLLTPESGRRYDAEDLALAEEMARRAGQIIENARLHQQLRHDVIELKEAREQLARELGFRERVMGILGHDLRNPVSAVLALTALLRRDDATTDKAREKLVVIEQSARRMNEMIGTLLDFTRLRFHGSLPVAVEEIDLDALVRGIVAELQAAHRKRAIELCASGDLRGRWDPGRIAQLVSNLAANALSHGALESPVRVSLAGEAEAVLLSVSNRGPVIPPELVDRLFEPFQQGTDSNGNGRGLGLGLFIVREIVRAHGGTIDIRSCDDLTSFAVTLPRTRLSLTRDTAFHAS